MSTNRYTEEFRDYGGRACVVCRDCSTRSTAAVIPADEQAHHDAWHVSVDTLVAVGEELGEQGKREGTR
jgi:hypothetical protein